MRQGRKRQILDVFGPWVPSEQVVVQNLEPLPPSVISSEKILLWGFELEEENKLPFSVFDRLMEDGIDVTGLTISNTSRGNLYRAHRLMKH